MLPVAEPLRTGKSPPPLTGPATVSLFDAFGWLLPPLMQAYSALASAEQLTCSVSTVVPSPASLNVQTRLPSLSFATRMTGSPTAPLVASDRT
jgi:hypothetical protein